MINVHYLNGGDFARLGFTFETPGETELFANVIREELEARVDQAVGRDLTDAQVKEFAFCLDPGESAFWLEKHCPDYREIVLAEQARLEDELLEFRAMIPGAIAVPPPELSGVAVEDLGLSVRSLNCLKQAGLNTVGKIASNGGLSQIPNIRQRSEISVKLWELMDDIPTEHC